VLQPVELSVAFDLPRPLPRRLPARRAPTPRTAPETAHVRGKLASLGDDAPTLTLDRDEIAASLLPDARRDRPSIPRAHPTLPVPHFRSRAQVAPLRPPRAILVAPPAKRGGVPVGFWLFAALIAGLLSFQLAPRAKASLEQAVRLLEDP
jgi:hypothetical protein